MSMPPPIHEWWRYRTAGLLILSVACLRLGVAFTPISDPSREEIPQALKFITAFLPPPSPTWEPAWFLGYCWLALGFVSVGAIWVRRWHSLVFVLGSAASVYFGLAYLFAQFDSNSPDRSWNNAWIYLFQALAVGFIGLITRIGGPTETPSGRPNVDAV